MAICLDVKKNRDTIHEFVFDELLKFISKLWKYIHFN